MGLSSQGYKYVTILVTTHIPNKGTYNRLFVLLCKGASGSGLRIFRASVLGSGKGLLRCYSEVRVWEFQKKHTRT